jgi:hypothetical protein
MKNIARLLIVGGLIAAESLLAQTAPTDQGPGPRPRGPGGPGGHGGPGRLSPIVRVLDADRDGAISAAEIAGSAAAIRTLDANADGTVSRDEMRPMRPADAPKPPADAPAPPAEAQGRGPRGPHGSGGPDGQGGRPHPIFPVMLALDADADGALSATEINNAPASLKALDADGDGKLSREELRPLPPTN